jgi:hypothetical protein
VKLFALAFSSLACFSVGASASPSERAVRESTKIFWNYAKCMVDHSGDEARQLLDKREWNEEDCEAAVKLAKSKSGCVPAGTSLSFSSALFRGSVAGAAFVKNRRGQPLPNYTERPMQKLRRVVVRPCSPSQVASSDRILKMSGGFWKYGPSVAMKMTYGRRLLRRLEPVCRAKKACKSAFRG